MTASPVPAPRLDATIRRVLCRPRPWILRYGLAMLPSLLFSLLLLYPLRPWFQIPLLVEALETRSLDYLLEVLMEPGDRIAGGSVLVLAMLLLPVFWLLVRGLWIFLEGGILKTYVHPDPLSWREFFRACWHWFGALLLLGGMWLVVTMLVAMMAGVAGMLARSLWAPLGTVIFIVGALGVVLLWLWFSLARSTSVVCGDQNVFRALGRAARVIGRRPIRVLALFVGVVGLQGLLSLALRAGTSLLPYAWWLPALVLQQLVAVLSTGLTLARRVGEVGLAAQVFPDVRMGGATADPVSVEIAAGYE